MKRWNLIAVPAILLITLTLTRADAPPPGAATPAASPTTRPAARARKPEDAITPAIKDPNRHAQFLYRIKEGDIGLLFMGDSILDNWPRVGEFTWLKFAPYHPADFGISGDSTQHVLWRITHGELDGIHPKVIVLMIGTNNIGHVPADQPDWAAAGVVTIVQTMRDKLPDTKILLLGVFPRDLPGSRTRDAVAQINQIISKLDDGKSIRYLDIGHVFLDADGTIPKDIMADRLHPTAKGYERWYDAMEPLLEEMMK